MTRTTINALRQVASTPNFLIGTLGILLKTFHLARRLQEADVRHIHAHFATHPTMAAWIIHQLTGIPYSFTVHAHDLYVHTAMLQEKIASARFVVTISEYNRWILSDYGNPSNVHLIHCGIDLSEYPVQLAPPPGIFTIVSVASLQPYKGLAFLIHACALLRKRGVSSFRCRIAGGGELRAELQQLITRLDLGGIVELLGPQPQEAVAALLQTAHVFVLPSIVTSEGKMEGLPVVLMEALAVGLPVIATNISGIPEIVRRGITGQLVPPGNPEALADALERVMRQPELAYAEGRRGRQLVEQEFCLSRNVEELTRLFQASFA